MVAPVAGELLTLRVWVAPTVMVTDPVSAEIEYGNFVCEIHIKMLSEVIRRYLRVSEVAFP